MKIKNMCSQKNYKKVNEILETSEFVISEEADVVIIDKNDDPVILTGFADDYIVKLNSDSIILIESYSNHIYAKTEKETIQIKCRLYEVKLLLSEKGFFQVNKSQIINLKSIVKIKPMLNYRIKVHLQNGSIVFVSRKYYHTFIEEFEK